MIDDIVGENEKFKIEKKKKMKINQIFIFTIILGSVFCQNAFFPNLDCQVETDIAVIEFEMGGLRQRSRNKFKNENFISICVGPERAR